LRFSSQEAGLSRYFRPAFFVHTGIERGGGRCNEEMVRKKQMKLQWNAHDSEFEEDGRWGFEHPWFKLE
jgi:hypothetical protein